MCTDRREAWLQCKGSVLITLYAAAEQVQKARSDLAVVMALAVPALGSVLADPLMSLVRLHS